MAKGRRMPMGMPGGGNMSNMMKQVQKMQKQMEEMQRDLEQREVEATSGGGVVSVKVNGKKNLLELKIDPEAVDKDDVEMLEDMIVAAINEAFRKAEEMMESEMKKVTGGVNIPGLI
ncbi:MAG: YbaB/EbfC family nucleoid-associated protein [Bacillota bacterium]|jgi:DNA-binding YbaB/EbfC family protein|nr:YbaB/EbfC family nucleoid-associated protein [Bacillota bacterium]NLL59496.1 YbaB/EbfC family nucleoid-associated protein [Tissierellia bacterium]